MSKKYRRECTLETGDIWLYNGKTLLLVYRNKYFVCIGGRDPIATSGHRWTHPIVHESMEYIGNISKILVEKLEL